MLDRAQARLHRSVRCFEALRVEPAPDVVQAEVRPGELQRRGRIEIVDLFRGGRNRPMPDMLVSLSWETVEQFFATEVPRLL